MKSDINYYLKLIFFHFYLLIQDFSLNIGSTHSQFYGSIDNIYMEGAVSQNFDIGPIGPTKKNGKILIIFSRLFSTFHKTNTRTYIKILIHCSL